MVIRVQDGTEDQAINQEVKTVHEKVIQEWDHVPSNHVPDAVKISVSDPVFVNPNSVKTVAEVLCRVGSMACVSHYGFSGESLREWISVSMDGLPFLIAENIIEQTFYLHCLLKECFQC